MARHEITNGQLLALKNEIENAQRQSMIFHFFQYDKVKRFNQLNSIQLKVLSEKINRLLDLHVKHEGGKPVTHMAASDTEVAPVVIKKPFWPWQRQKVQPAQAPRLVEQYVFKSKAHEKMYLDDINEFMSRVVTVDI